MSSEGKTPICEDISEAVRYLADGKIIAYPTEGVFGLGCDPFNEQAVMRLLQLKQRSITKGLILIASHWGQINDLILPLDAEQVQTVNNTTSPTTWVFPASSKAPRWITGDHQKIAIRLTKFPLARSLCEKFNKPIVSTSANKSGQPAAKNVMQVIAYFNDNIDFILKGKIGNLNKPTEMRDIMTGAILRE